MKKLLAIILIVSAQSCTGYIVKYNYKKFECKSDGEYVIKPICQLKAVARDVQSILISMEVAKPLKNLFFRVIHTKKTYTNHYMPGLFDLRTNYCQLANETIPTTKFALDTLKTLAPGVYDQYRKNIKYCPLMGYYLVINSTAKNTIIEQHITPPGEYKIDYRLVDAADRILFQVVEYKLVQDKNRRSWQ
jgi:hypothetical protein